jgi:plasmid stabilization system protein ParE
LHIDYRPEFFDDLDDIFEYISGNFNPDLARQIVAAIFEGTKILKDQPRLGREYPRNPYFRHLIVEKKNLVFYHLEGETITIHRIFDSRRDYIDAVNYASEIK